MGYTVVVVSLSCFSVSPFSPSRSSYSCKLDFVVPARETGGALRLNRGSGNQTYGGCETRWKWKSLWFGGLERRRRKVGAGGPPRCPDGLQAPNIVTFNLCARIAHYRFRRPNIKKGGINIFLQ